MVTLVIIIGVILGCNIITSVLIMERLRSLTHELTWVQREMNELKKQLHVCKGENEKVEQMLDDQYLRIEKVIKQLNQPIRYGNVEVQFINRRRA